MNIPNNVKTICKTLKEQGYAAYIVGGAVRDMLLNRQPHDFDIATNAKPDEVSKLLKTYPSGIAFGTVTALIDEEAYEITTFRTDGDYSDGRHPNGVTYADTIKEDLSRRDFTINAMAYDVIDDRLIDPYNGAKDIFNHDTNCGLIRAVGDAKKRFCEDALRMLRAARFRAQLGYEIEGTTYDAICELHENIKLLSKERIAAELSKILTAECSADGIRILRDTKLLRDISPVLDDMFHCEQKNRWHYTNVGEHTLDVIKNTPSDLHLRWVALLHDIGKMEAKVVKENGEDSFSGHAINSAEIADTLLRELKFSNEDRERIVNLVREHSTVYYDIPSIRRYAAKHGKDFLIDLHTFQIADAKAHTSEFVKTAIEQAETFYIQCLECIKDGTAIQMRDLKINGNDLLTIGIKGKQIGECLETLYDHCLNVPSDNTHETLLRLAKQKVFGREAGEQEFDEIER